MSEPSPAALEAARPWTEQAAIYICDRMELSERHVTEIDYLIRDAAVAGLEEERRQHAADRERIAGLERALRDLQSAVGRATMQFGKYWNGEPGEFDDLADKMNDLRAANMVASTALAQTGQEEGENE